MASALYAPGARNRTFEAVSRSGLRGRVRGLVDPDWRFPWEEPVTVEAGEG